MEAPEAVTNILNFIDQLNCNRTVDVQHLRADHPISTHTHEEALCSDDNRRETYVKQPRTIHSRYVKRAQRRADAAAISIPIVSVQWGQYF